LELKGGVPDFSASKKKDYVTQKNLNLIEHSVLAFMRQSPIFPPHTTVVINQFIRRP
jgi:diadenosine tetraphosphate (Ap4A) HIT family hydrolase